MFETIYERHIRGEPPVGVIDIVKAIFMICAVLLICIGGSNNYKPENLESGGDNKPTVKQEELDELNKKRMYKLLESKKESEIRTKEQDEKLLNNMREFQKKLMNRNQGETE
jgi:hypothetical protein